MEYRRLGQSGLKISALSLGGWITFGNSVKDEKLAKKIIHTAYDSGVNFFDIADIYAKGESEKLMGSILKDFPRHTLVVSSKAFWSMSDDVNDRGLSRKHLMESIDKSLQRIGTDYLDIYFCHRYDEETPLEETCRV
ncbi:MAG: aldo/keto reductase, partial [Anaerolineae bacterium]|nr:aldo/keto reductase [Anaerolineae bacterium]